MFKYNINKIDYYSISVLIIIISSNFDRELTEVQLAVKIRLFYKRL